MTIKEWLTPDFFAVNVVLVTIMMCWTIFALASNFLEDFPMSARTQAANYFGVVLMTVVFAVLLMVMSPIKTIYPNRFDWLLIGNAPVLGSVVAGIIGGWVLAFIFGEKVKLRWGAAVMAVACEGLIGGAVLLWILNQQ